MLQRSMCLTKSGDANVPFGFDYDLQHLMPLRDLESHVFKSVVSLAMDISIAFRK